MLTRLFHLPQHGTTVGREILGGVVSFVAMSYIIFVQPALLSQTGMPFGAVMFATCIASAVACFLMAFLANLPVALAPAMGHNVLFVFTICLAVGRGGFGLSWQEALAANFIAGGLFVLLSFVGMREAIMRALPDCLKYAIAVGIGLLIALIGLEWGNIVVAHPVKLVDLGKLRNPAALLTLFGLTVTAILMARRIRGAVLIGIVLTGLAGYLATKFIDGMAYPLLSTAHRPALEPAATFLKLDFAGLFNPHKHPPATWLAVIVIFFMLDLFDTIGTLFGVCERADLLTDGQVPRARQALFSDSAATVLGTVLGTSTVTSYVESAAGVAAGARTGLASIVTGLLLLLSLAAYPVVHLFGAGVDIDSDPNVFAMRYPVIAPVLILIGCLMLPSVRKIQWDDLTEAIPAFLCMVIMQFAFSIAAGIAWGFISYALLKLASGRGRQVHWFVYLFAALFVLMYVVGWMPGS